MPAYLQRKQTDIKNLFNFLVKSATDLSSKSSLTSKTSKSSSKTSLTSSKASPSDDERKNMKKFKLDIKGMGAAPQSIVDKPEYRYFILVVNLLYS